MLRRRQEHQHHRVDFVELFFDLVFVFAVTQVSHALIERARNLSFQYHDKDLSFTDCTSFAVMRELRLTTVITTDGHFRQVGFDVLPAARPRRTRKPRRA
jgi:predicted nucleic acid-binding protein